MELTQAQIDRGECEHGRLKRKCSACDLIEAEKRIAQLEKQNKILTLKNSGTLANNLCPDHRDKQSGKSCLACRIEHLKRGLREIEELPSGYAFVIAGVPTRLEIAVHKGLSQAAAIAKRCREGK